MLTLIILLVFTIGCLLFLGNYVVKNMQDNPNTTLFVAILAVPVLLTTAYLTVALISTYKEDKACDMLGGEIVGEQCIDIRQAPVILLPESK